MRTERETDWPAVHSLNRAAFETANEAMLVDALRREAHPIVSLVAEEDGTLVGHILFSPVTLAGHPGLRMMGLAPMAVAPARQRQGIGTALVHAGLEHCKMLKAGAVAVLGHPHYYPRFGFTRSDHFGISSEYDAPPEAFMLLELEAGCLRGKTGVIKYHAAFANV